MRLVLHALNILQWQTEESSPCNDVGDVVPCGALSQQRNSLQKYKHQLEFKSTQKNKNGSQWDTGIPFWVLAKLSRSGNSTANVGSSETNAKTW